MTLISSYLRKSGVNKDVFIKINGNPVSLLTIGYYSFEWLMYTIILVFAQFSRRLIHPRFSDFSLRDPSISYNTYGQRDLMFPYVGILILTAGISLLSGGVLNSLTYRYSTSRKLWNTHCSFLTVLGTNALQSLIVSILKNVIGGKRPDLLARCIPNTDPLTIASRTIDIGSCTTENLRILADGFRSFPSGTAATAFSNLTLVTFLLLSRVNLYQHPTSSNSLTLPLVGLPVFFATLIGTSTLADNRHFMSDSIVGGIIGISSATLIYRQYFPQVWRSPMILTLANGEVAEQDMSLAYEPRRFFNDVEYWQIDSDEKRIEDVVSNSSTVRGRNVQGATFHSTRTV